MANAVITTPQPAGPPPVRGFADGNKKVRYFDMKSDTGNYNSGGLTITAASLGLRRVDFVATSGGVATAGAAGALGNPVGITYATDGTSFTVWVYEGSAAGTALGQKTNAEAMETNWIIRLRVEGF